MMHEIESGFAFELFGISEYLGGLLAIENMRADTLAPERENRKPIHGRLMESECGLLTDQRIAASAVTHAGTRVFLLGLEYSQTDFISRS